MLPWKIVAGAFLHFALPAYLLIGLGCCAVGLLDGRTPDTLASLALPYSIRFAALYLALAIVTTLAALSLDPLLRRRRRRRAARDPDAARRRSHRDLTTALADGRAKLDRDAVAALDAIASLSWHHEEPRFQHLSANLAEVVRTAVAAFATTTPDRRQELTAVTTKALDRIAAGLRDLQEERCRLDEGDLRTVARYIDSRYPPSDYAGDSAN